MKSFFAIPLLIWASLAGADVVQTLASSPQLLVPVAGSTPGANGTFFRSDIAIANFGDYDQLVRLQWLPQGLTSSFSTTITIPARSGVRSLDFVREIVGQSGLGAIVITGVTSTGEVDQSAALHVQSRIWTNEPDTGGTTSQTLPSIPTSAISSTKTILLGLGVPFVGSYRVNVGIVNLDPLNEQTFYIGTTPRPLPPFAKPVTVPPMSMQQIALGTSDDVAFELEVQNGTPVATRSNLWIAYGSTVDNITGDAWSELGAVNVPALCCIGN